MDAEVQHCGGENYRGGGAVQEKLLVMQGSIHRHQFDFFRRGRPRIPFTHFGLLRAVMLLGGDGGAAGGADEVDVFLWLTVIADLGEPTEVAGFTHRPKQGSGLQADLLHDLIHELERRHTGAVPLVDHRDDRQATGLAHAEQLQCLGLQALRAVNKHYGRIHRGENAIGVLREIRVAGRIHQVDHVGLARVALWCVFEL